MFVFDNLFIRLNFIFRWLLFVNMKIIICKWEGVLRVSVLSSIIVDRRGVWVFVGGECISFKRVFGNFFRINEVRGKFDFY